jgi:hypothetical protein
MNSKPTTINPGPLKRKEGGGYLESSQQMGKYPRVKDLTITKTLEKIAVGKRRIGNQVKKYVT